MILRISEIDLKKRIKEAYENDDDVINIEGTPIEALILRFFEELYPASKGQVTLELKWRYR